MSDHRAVSPNGTSLKRDIIAYAQSLGFARVGFTTADPFLRDAAALEAWVQAGHHGQMSYLERQRDKRSDPRQILPNAQSIIALAMSYYNEIPASAEGLSPSYKVARYAWAKDYHRLIRKRLEALVRYLEALAPAVECRTLVDTGPFLERAAAQRAGLGFVGKNTMAITRGLGSWVFLAHVITTLVLPTDQPDRRSCGTCTLCLEACPTQAFKGPYDLDARRCIAYLTIELKDTMDLAMRGKTGDWLFGCDICQDVCPHNTRIPRTSVPDLQAGPPAYGLEEILNVRTEEEFRARFSATPLMRAGRHGLIRNACSVAVYQKRKDLIPDLKRIIQEDPHPVVREHAQWAVDQLFQP